MDPWISQLCFVGFAILVFCFVGRGLTRFLFRETHCFSFTEHALLVFVCHWDNSEPGASETARRFDFAMSHAKVMDARVSSGVVKCDSKASIPFARDMAWPILISDCFVFVAIYCLVVFRCCKIVEMLAWWHR